MGNEQAIVTEREPTVHRITVEEFLALDEAGFFEETGRVELIDGEIFEMAPLHRPHAKTLWELTIAVGLALREMNAKIEGLGPVSARLDSHSLPEADIVIADVLAEDEDKFVTPRTVRILIEVSASSLRHDLGRKTALYARTGVPEYWVADVNGRRIIRMHETVEGAYTRRVEFAFGDMIAAATIEGLMVDTSRLA